MAVFAGPKNNYKAAPKKKNPLTLAWLSMDVAWLIEFHLSIVGFQCSTLIGIVYGGVLAMVQGGKGVLTMICIFEIRIGYWVEEIIIVFAASLPHNNSNNDNKATTLKVSVGVREKTVKRRSSYHCNTNNQWDPPPGWQRVVCWARVDDCH